MSDSPFGTIQIKETYRSTQNGFLWVFLVLGIGPRRIRVRQSSTEGGFLPRSRLLTVAQWEEFSPVLDDNGEERNDANSTT